MSVRIARARGTPYRQARKAAVRIASRDDLLLHLAVRETEEHFQAWILAQMRLYGWVAYHTRNSQKSTEGFPDIIAVRPPHVLAVEVKRESGVVTLAQEMWLALFERCGVQVAIWRPSQRDQAIRTLSRRDV